MVAGLRRFFLALSGAGLIGCGAAAPPSDNPASQAHGPEAASAGAPESMHPVGGGAMTSPPPGMLYPPGPAGSVMAALDHVQAGRLELAYDFLPASFQSDIDQLVRSFAEKMDPEVWDELFSVLEKGIKVLRTKKGLIVELMRNPDDADSMRQLSDNWEEMVEALDLVVGSEVSDLDRLKQASSRRFLESTGNPLFAQLQKLGSVAGPNPLEMLARTRVEVFEEAADVAILRFIVPDREEHEEAKFIRVDGKWIPLSLAEGWTESLAQAQKSVQSLSPTTLAAQKGQVMEGLAIFDAALDQMLDAETANQLQQAALPIMGQVIQAYVALQQRPAAPTGSVTIIVSGELGGSAQSQLLKDLEPLTDTPSECTYESSAGGGETTIMIRPVADPVAFAEKLSFAKAKSVDVGKRTIRIELAAP
ncbi:MAG: hypothetical protein SFV23_23795 [Planctomycetaceae bacterium]|nr:hypothetical protein [Planctomycetaceae bacterium]